MNSYRDRLKKIADGLESKLQGERLPANTRKLLTKIIQEIRKVLQDGD